MFDDELKAVWKRAGAAEASLADESIARAFDETPRHASRVLTRVVWMYVAMLAVTTLLALSNIVVFANDPTLLAVEVGVAFASAASIAFGLRVIALVRRSERGAGSLLETIEGQLALQRRVFEPWLVCAAFTPWLFTLALNSRIDAVDGTYQIHHPVEFAVVSVAMLAITYVGLRLSLRSTLFELNAVAHDLRVDALELAPRIPDVRRRSRWWIALVVALLALAVLASLYLWWSHA